MFLSSVMWMSLLVQPLGQQPPIEPAAQSRATALARYGVSAAALAAAQVNSQDAVALAQAASAQLAVPNPSPASRAVQPQSAAPTSAATQRAQWQQERAELVGRLSPAAQLTLRQGDAARSMGLFGAEGLAVASDPRALKQLGRDTRAERRAQRTGQSVPVAVAQRLSQLRASSQVQQLRTNLLQTAQIQQSLSQ